MSVYQSTHNLLVLLYFYHSFLQITLTTFKITKEIEHLLKNKGKAYVKVPPIGTLKKRTKNSYFH